MAETKIEKKYKAARRAQFRLGQTFDRIDFEEDVLAAEIEKMKAQLTSAKLPEISVESDED